MVFHSEYRADPATYHNVTSVRLRGPFEPQRLERALAEVIGAHPVLRTSFDVATFTEPLQLEHERVPTPLVVARIAHLEPSEQGRVIDAAIEAERRRPFDWASPPLLRFEAYGEATGRSSSSGPSGHGILDGWSLHLLLDELL